MKPKLLITIEGGTIQGICSNMDIDIVMNDYDQNEDNQISILQPDVIFKDGLGHKMYHRISPPLSSQEITIREYLKESKF